LSFNLEIFCLFNFFRTQFVTVFEKITNFFEAKKVYLVSITGFRDICN